MQKSPTINEIAQRCGVSPATVSRVLNRHAYVSEGVRQRISAELEKLNYRHTAFSTGYVAVIYPPPTHTTGRCGGMRTDAYSLMVCDALSRELAASHFRGIFLSMCDYEIISQGRFCGVISLVPFEQLPVRNSCIPTVYVNGFPERSTNIFHVASDEKQGMELALAYLSRYRHRHVGLLCVGDDFMNQVRRSAFVSAAKRHSVEYAVQIVPPGSDLYEQLGILLDAGVSALLIPGEEVGLKVTYALQLYRHRIPQDISVISWEVQRISEYWYPRLTTVSQDFAQIAVQAVGIISQCRKNEHPPFQISVPYALIERHSVRTMPAPPH